MILAIPELDNDFKINLSIPNKTLNKDVELTDFHPILKKFNPPTSIKEDVNGNIVLGVIPNNQKIINQQPNLTNDQKIMETDIGLAVKAPTPEPIMFGDPINKDIVTSQDLPKVEIDQQPEILESVVKESKKSNIVLIVSILALILTIYMVWK